MDEIIEKLAEKIVNVDWRKVMGAKERLVEETAMRIFVERMLGGDEYRDPRIEGLIAWDLADQFVKLRDEENDDG